MTWRTPEGERYLIGAEARLFRSGLRYSLEQLETDDLNRRGTFLQNEPRRSCLHLFEYVASYMLRPTSDVCPLNAWTEGAVAVIFDSIRDSLLVEIDDEFPTETPSTYWRSLVHEAAHEVGVSTVEENAERPREPLNPASSLAHELELMLDVLADMILWDCDWQFEQDDQIPSLMAEDDGVSYFYWQSRPTQSTDEVIHSLGRLCGFKRGDFEGEAVN